jgi:hypothetical protein
MVQIPAMQRVITRPGIYKLQLINHEKFYHKFLLTVPSD